LSDTIVGSSGGITNMHKTFTVGFVACLLSPVLSIAEMPGVDAIINGSSDIIIAKVTSTNPRKAIEGARDTVNIQVLRTLKGPLQTEDTIGVYYHLLWVDTTTWELEKPNFIKGEDYIIFLKSHTVQSGDTKSTEYELTDRWLSVQQNHPDLAKSILSSLDKAKRPNQ
jgi:hypothetical protein